MRVSLFSALLGLRGDGIFRYAAAHPPDNNEEGEEEEEEKG